VYISAVQEIPDNRMLESVVWGGGRWQLPGTTKEALGRRHTEVVRHDTIQQASHHAQDRATWRNLIAGLYGSWTTGQEEEVQFNTPYKSSNRTSLSHRHRLCGAWGARVPNILALGLIQVPTTSFLYNGTHINTYLPLHAFLCPRMRFTAS